MRPGLHDHQATASEVSGTSTAAEPAPVGIYSLNIGEEIDLTWATDIRPQQGFVGIPFS
jgi:hypothetical protein